MAITKNRQSEETISSMAKAAFPDKQVAKIKELAEGMCNITYDITFKDDKSAFEIIHNASLVHWDMWEGNVFVK